MNTSEESTFNVRTPELKITDELVKEYLLSICYVPNRPITDATKGTCLRHGPYPLEMYGFVEETKLTNMSFIKYML